MTDPRFESVYLEGQPRRSSFRAARDRLKDQCGDHTLAGDLRQLTDYMTAEKSAPSVTYWVKDGDRLHPLSFGVNSIGRMPDNTVVLNDGHVSRRHCAIVIHRSGDCEVHDIASKNGTILNGAVVSEPTPLRPGDVLNLSNHRIVLVARVNESSNGTPMPADATA